MRLIAFKCSLNISGLKFILLLFRWFFACVSISGVFAVTFSVVFAYVADCTDETERSQAYGLVRAIMCLHCKNLFSITFF